MGFALSSIACSPLRIRILRFTIFSYQRMSAGLLLILLIQSKLIMSLIGLRGYIILVLGYVMNFHFFFKESKQYMGVSLLKILVFDVLRLGSFLNNGLEHQRYRISAKNVSFGVEFVDLQDAYTLISNFIWIAHMIITLDMLDEINQVFVLYKIARPLYFYLPLLLFSKSSNNPLLIIIIMNQIEVVQNTFDKSSLQRLMKILKLVNFNQPRNKIAEELDEVTPKQYLWAIGTNPAYFVQYQVKSAAIFRVKQHILIGWKPKFIEYPSMIVFPEVKDKLINSMKMELDEKSTTTQYTNNSLMEFIGKFYGTYFYSDPRFETNLVTFAKHFVSKISKHSYWHVLLEDTDMLFTTQPYAMDSVIKIRITGLKDGYDKTLLLFSFKGVRDNIFMSAKNKWMQVVSFLAMIVIFYAVVACPSGGSTEGICQYKSEMTLGGAGMMLALLGLRFGQKAKKKKAQTNAVGGHEKTQ